MEKLNLKLSVYRIKMSVLLAQLLPIPVPFWYKIFTKELSLQSYKAMSDVSGIINHAYTDSECYTLFYLCLLFDSDVYIDKMHILSHIISKENLETPTPDKHILFAYYMYILVKGDYADENIICDIAEKFGDGVTIKLPDDFNYTYLHQWIMSILNKLFDIGFIDLEIPEVDSDKMLSLAVAYDKFLSNHRFVFGEKETARLYKLAYLHESLEGVGKFLLGEGIPDFLARYGEDEYFIQKICEGMMPAALYSIYREKEFSNTVIDKIKLFHSQMHARIDINFFLRYAELFTDLFGREHVLSKNLARMLLPSRENDVRLARSACFPLSSHERAALFLSDFIVSDQFLEEFYKSIFEMGFELAIGKFATQNLERLNEKIAKQGLLKGNNTICTTSTRIEFYNEKHLVFHIESSGPSSGSTCFIFLATEISQFAQDLNHNTLNPYTRQILPATLLRYSQKNILVESLEEMWKKILRRDLALESSN